MLRSTRPLLSDAVPAVGKALRGGGVSAATAAADDAAATSLRSSGVRRSPPLGERYDAAGYPKQSLNPKYSSLIVGQHFDKVVHDKRTQMMAVLSACNMIREVIAAEGRILIHCKEPRMEADLLAAARDCGEFTHFGKWPPGGFTNRPQVSVVPQLPSLVICLEHDNHVMMREAFQMCIPRIAPVDVYNNKADFTPEVPLHAARMTLGEKRRMLTFFSAFIAKLKFGQMPVGDTQGKFKEFAARMFANYQASQRDIPEPYIKAYTRLYDGRPDLKYGVDPRHTAYNEKRAFEESTLYHIAAQRPDSYRDAGLSPDDLLMEDPPSIEEDQAIPEVIEYSTMSERFVEDVDSDRGSYVQRAREDGSVERVDEFHAPDYETQEYLAMNQAAYEAGVRSPSHRLRKTQDQVRQEYEASQKELERASPEEVREDYEEWFKDQQDAENTTIPYARETHAPLQSNWSVPGEDATQQRLWKIKNRVREMRLNTAEAEKRRQEEAEVYGVPAPGKKKRFIRPKRSESHLLHTPVQPAEQDIQEFKIDEALDMAEDAEAGMQPQPRGADLPYGGAYSQNYRTPEQKAQAGYKPLNLARGKRNFSTSTRRMAAAVAEPESAAPSAATPATPSSSSSSSSRRFPRFLLPAFLIAPIFAYFAATQHSDEDDLARVQREQQQAWKEVKEQLGIKAKNKPISSAESARLRTELGEAQSYYDLLVQTHTLVLDKIPPEKRHEHQAILEEFEFKKQELEQQIKDIQAKLGPQ